MSFPAILPPSENRQFSTFQTGLFYFAQTGHYHFAVTPPEILIDLYITLSYIRVQGLRGFMIRVWVSI
jgi:hypothetical protein